MTFGGAVTPLPAAKPTLVLQVTDIKDDVGVGEDLLQSPPFAFLAYLFNAS